MWLVFGFNVCYIVYVVYVYTYSDGFYNFLD